MINQTDTMRAAFEAWFAEECIRKQIGGNMVHIVEEMMWSAWQASRTDADAARLDFMIEQSARVVEGKSGFLVVNGFGHYLRQIASNTARDAIDAAMETAKS